MGGFGERMQREREMRSISLEEIAESTKIGCRMLRALEEEDFEKLPGGIFNKGFVRAYAKFLGIDEEQAVADFQTAFVEKQSKHPTNGANGIQHGEILPQIEANAIEHEPEPDQAAGFMRAAIIIICIVGVAGLGWKFLGSKTSTETPASTVPPASVTAPVKQSPVPTQPAVGKPQADALAQTKSPALIVPSPELTKDASPAKDAADPAATAADSAASLANPGEFRIRVRTIERAWVQITADGKLVQNGEIPPSSSRSFRASKEMVVKLGNAPGVELSYNGKALPQFPPDQKTRTLTFTPDGLRP